MKTYMRAALVFILLGGLFGCKSNNDGDGGNGDIVTPPSSSSSSSSSTGGSNIVNTPLPILEDFGSYTNFDQADTIDFFSENYMALATPAGTDPRPSFYYPTCCFFDSDDPGGNITVDHQNRMGIISDDGDPSLLLSNARFAVGETNSALAGTVSDPKRNSTPGDDVSNPNAESWGELDLSQDYKITFCVGSASGSANMQIYVDNNTTGEANSIHGGGGTGSRIFNVPASELVAGGRVEINIPGDTLINGVLRDTKTTRVGTENSFLQVRVENGASVILDDFYIEYQGATTAPPPCNTFTPATPPATPDAPNLVAGDGQINVSWAAVIGAISYDVLYNTVDATTGGSPQVIEDITTTNTTIPGLANGAEYFVFIRASNSAGDSEYGPSASAIPTAAVSTTAIPFTEDFSAADASEYFSAAYKSLSDDAGEPLNNVTGGGSNITVNGTALTFNNARFTIGDKNPGTATTAATQHAGDFDLSQPYTITFDVITNTNTGGNFFVYVDNNTTSSGASVHSTIGSTASRIFSKPSASVADGDAQTGTVTINSSVGTATSFIQIRTDSGTTDPITIDNLTITYQSTGTPLPFTEDFSAADQATYFSAAYKSLSDDAGSPLNNVTGGGSNITVNGTALTFNNARFTIGDKDPGTATTAATQHAGDFDLSQPYTITFDVITNTNTGGNFFVYVDNNTTSSGASVHSTIGSTASRIFNKPAASVSDGDAQTGTVTINSSVGTATSFIQIRTDSGTTDPITIDNLTIDYQ